LRAFSKIEYHFEVGLQSGEVLTSPTAELDYIDNRYNWQKKMENPFQVHWYEEILQLLKRRLMPLRLAAENPNDPTCK